MTQISNQNSLHTHDAVFANESLASKTQSNVSVDVALDLNVTNSLSSINALSCSHQACRLEHWMNISEDICRELTSHTDNWGTELKSEGLNNFSWSIGGSMKCGHFMGPKPSRNPDIGGSNGVVEVDLRLLIPDSFDPISDSLKSLVSDTLNIEWKKDSCCSQWAPDIQTPHSVFYGYREFDSSPDHLLEVELSVVRSSEFIELGNYWSQIFTSEEIEWQAFCRDYLRQSGCDYAESIRPIKTWQCQTARWRILAGYDSGVFDEQPPAMINHLIPTWTERYLPTMDDIEQLPLPSNLLRAPPTLGWVDDAVHKYQARRKHQIVT